MSKRIWEKGTITMAGIKVAAFTIRCSHPGCRTSSDIIDRNGHPISGPFLRQRFERKQWFVGDGLSEDLCPEHAKEAIEERRARRRPRATNLKLIPLTQGEQQTMPAEAPRTMTRDDKRIINIKLHEVYIGEREGYQTPWTDKKVAENLGVPAAWVMEIREDLFGPAADNSEVREFLDKANDARDQTAKILNEASTHVTQANLLMTRIKVFEDKIGEIRRLLETMNQTADRIKKAVMP